MGNTIVQFLPIGLLFVVGLGLRHWRVLERRHADRLLRLVVDFGLPALILSSLSRVPLHADLALIPVAAVLTVVTSGLAAYAAGRALRLGRSTLGVFVIGPMIMNLAFEYPFVLAAWGQQGFAYLVLFDFGNGLLTFTLVYAVASWYGDGGGRIGHALRGVATFPPFWAVLVALTINFSGVLVPTALADALQIAGRWIVLLVMLALGIYFDVRLWRAPALWAALALRLGLGLLLGLTWIGLFGLGGLSRQVVIVAVLAPIGFNTLVYASRENLDKPFAASLASLSVLLALVYLPVLLLAM